MNVAASAIALLIGTIGLAPQAMALCNNQYESQGCIVNDNGPQPCRGTNGDDTIVAPAGGCGLDINGQPVGCVISGRGGDDIIKGSDLSDTMCGNDGNDILLGNAGDDRMDGNRGVDIMLGGFGNDLLLGGSDGDSLIGGPGADTNHGAIGFDLCAEANANLKCEIVL